MFSFLGFSLPAWAWPPRAPRLLSLLPPLPPLPPPAPRPRKLPRSDIQWEMEGHVESDRKDGWVLVLSGGVGC